MYDYDIPFDGMSEDEFMYRSMNEDDPMYMGDTTYIEEDYVDTEYDDNYEERVADWYDTQFGKILYVINDLHIKSFRLCYSLFEDNCPLLWMRELPTAIGGTGLQACGVFTKKP